MNLSSLAGLSITVIAAIGLALIAFFQRRALSSFRNIRAFSVIQRASRLVVEDGTRLHVSLGNGDTLTPTGASALAGLVLLRNLGEITSLSDRPPVATTGNGLLNILAQDTLRTAQDAVADEQIFNMNNARLTGFTPFAYAAGAMTVIRDEDISSNVLIGNFGPEVGLLTEAVNRQNSEIIGASDNLTAQAVLFASSPDILIGEELFAAGAYVKAGSFHTASLLLQDIIRWLIIVALLVSAGLKLVGIL